MLSRLCCPGETRFPISTIIENVYFDVSQDFIVKPCPRQTISIFFQGIWETLGDIEKKTGRIKSVDPKILHRLCF